VDSVCVEVVCVCCVVVSRENTCVLYARIARMPGRQVPCLAGSSALLGRLAALWLLVVGKLQAAPEHTCKIIAFRLWKFMARIFGGKTRISTSS
jgi:hypothetical protein